MLRVLAPPAREVEFTRKFLTSSSPAETVTLPVETSPYAEGVVAVWNASSAVKMSRPGPVFREGSGR